MRLWEARYQLGEHDRLMLAWAYFLCCSYNNYYLPVLSQKVFSCFCYTAAEGGKGPILSSFGVQWAISRTGQKEKPLKSLICLSFLICLHFLSLFPHKFKRHKFSEQIL